MIHDPKCVTMTKSIICKNCNTQFQVDLSGSGPSELAVACPRCGQKYKFKRPSRVQDLITPPPQTKPTTYTLSLSSFSVGYLIAAAVSLIGLFLPWLSLKAEGGVSGIGSYSTSLEAVSGMSFWYGHLSLIAIIVSIYFLWQTQPKISAIAGFAIPLLSIIGAIQAASSPDVDVSFGAASYSSKSSPGPGLFITAIAGVFMGVLALRKQQTPTLSINGGSPTPLSSKVTSATSATVTSAASPKRLSPTQPKSDVATKKPDKSKSAGNNGRRIAMVAGSVVLLSLTAWWFLDLRHHHTLTEDERQRASEWLQAMESGPWVLLDRSDLASTYGTLQAQAPRIEADKYGHLKIEVFLNHVDANSSTLYNNVFERDHTDLYRPDLIQLFDQEEEIGAGGSLQVRWVAPDSAVVNFLGEEGPGLDLICIPQDRHAQLVERLAADQKARFNAQVDSLLADGGLLRRGVFRSYGCDDECHATFLEVINGQPMERSYICNNNRFGNIQLSSGDLLGAGDFTNRTLVGTQLLFVTKRALQDDVTMDVITGLTPVSESDITADIQMRLNITAQFDAVDLANDPTTSEISHPSTSPHGMAKDNKAIIHTIVEEMPSFPGGEAELFKYLSKNVRYPQTAQDAGITGVVYLTFVVGADGRIRDTKVLRGIGGGCDEEALRVARSMPPWNPGRQRGQTVNVQYNLPVRFLLR